MGTLAVGGVTGWVAVSQELLGLCVILWPAALASPRLSASSLPPASVPVGCSAGATVLFSRASGPRRRSQEELDSRSQAPPMPRVTLDMFPPSLSHCFSDWRVRMELGRGSQPLLSMRSQAALQDSAPQTT